MGFRVGCWNRCKLPKLKLGSADDVIFDLGSRDQGREGRCSSAAPLVWSVCAGRGAGHARNAKMPTK